MGLTLWRKSDRMAISMNGLERFREEVGRGRGGGGRIYMQGKANEAQ